MKGGKLLKWIAFGGIVSSLTSQALAACVSGAQDVSIWRSASELHTKISKVPAKSEFETTEIWADRFVKSLLNENISLNNAYWIEVYPQKGKITYNADDQTLEVPPSAFRTSVYKCDDVLPYQLMVDLFKTPCTYKSRAITVQDTNSEGKPYLGMNAYGATREVERSNSDFVTLFESPVGYDDAVWGSEVDAGIENLFKLPIPTDKAPAAKANVRFAALFKLRYPLVATNTKGFRATFDFPTRLEYTYRTLIGDLQCIAMVVPGTNFFAQRNLP